MTNDSRPEEPRRGGGEDVLRRIRRDRLSRSGDDGRIPRHALRHAREQKRQRFPRGRPDGGGEGPAGPGCNWLATGPRNICGRIRCLAIDPTNAQTLYAGAADGGVWKSTNGGLSWTATMDDQDSLSLGSIAIDPSSSGTLYAGTGEAVYLITESALIPPGSDNLAWYYEGAGVLKSTDAGGTWAPTGALENDFIYRVAVDPFDSVVVICVGYAADPTRGGLCRSADGGATWTTIIQGVFTDVVFDPSNTGLVYVGQRTAGVLKSTDHGATWNSRNGGLPADATIGQIKLSIAASNSNVLYIKTDQVDTINGDSDLGVFRTATAAEGAAAWAKTTDPGVDGGFPWWCSHIRADPSDPTGNTVWAGGISVARSDDGGTTWTLMADPYGGTAPPTHADQHDLVFDPTNSNHVYIANDGGVFSGSYTAPSTTWSKVSAGLAVTQFYDVQTSLASPSMFGGGTQDNGTLVSTALLSWRQITDGDGGYILFHPNDPYTIYSEADTTVYKSTDGGATRAVSSSGIAQVGIFPDSVLAMDPNNPATLFFGGDTVYRSTNGAASWAAAGPSLNPDVVTAIAVAPSSSAVVYAGTAAGRLLRATDGGGTPTSFVDITPAVSGFPARWLATIAVLPTDSNTIYLSFLGFNGTSASSNAVWKGVFAPGPGTWNWSMIAGNLPNAPSGSLLIHPTTSDLYLATDVGVFFSVNNGASWTSLDAGMPNTAVVKLALDATRNELRAATHGRSMFRYLLGTACPSVDLYVVDNILDTGEFFPSDDGVPDPTQVGGVIYHYESADIKVNAPPYDVLPSLVDGINFDNIQHTLTSFGYPVESIPGITDVNPIRTDTNIVYVQVHNRGWQTAAAVTVKLIFADAGLGLPPLPANFWTAFPGDAYDHTHWNTIGTTTITDLLPGDPQVVLFNWIPASSVSDHVCLVAMLDSPQDPLLPETELVVDVLTPQNKKVTQKNVHPVTAPSPRLGPITWGLRLYNPFPEYLFYEVRIEHLAAKSSHIMVFLPRAKAPRHACGVLVGASEFPDPRIEIGRILREGRRISDYLEDSFERMEPPIGFEVKVGASLARIGGLHLAPHDAVPFVVALSAPPPAAAGPFSFNVNQYLHGRLIGGSRFIVR